MRWLYSAPPGLPGTPIFQLPVDPIGIAQGYGLTVYEGTLDPGVSGMLAKRAGVDPAIYLNRLDSEKRQRLNARTNLVTPSRVRLATKRNGNMSIADVRVLQPAPNDLGNKELDQLTGRFNVQNGGEIGLLINRSFEDKPKFLQRCHDAASKGRGYVVALDDEDLIALTNARAADDPIAFFQLLSDRFGQLIE